MFRYLPAAGDSSDGVAVVEDSLVLNGGTINSTASSDAVRLAHPGVDADTDHQVDATFPTLVEIVYSGRVATLIFDEELDSTSVPVTGQFTATLGNSATPATTQSVRISPGANTVEVTFDQAFVAGEQNLVSYSYTSSDATHMPIQDVAGNDATVGAPTKPSRPAAPAVTATSPVSLRVSWASPLHLGPDGAVDDYDLRWYQGDADPDDEADWVEDGETGAWPDPGTNTEIEVRGLTANTAYRVQVRAHGGGESDWSDSGSATTQMALSGARALVSSIDAADHATVVAGLATFDWGQDFWTPGYGGGYLLGSVEVDFATAPSGVEVLIRARGDTGFGPVVATLANPATLVAGNNTFTAPEGTVLDPRVRYYVIVRATSGNLSVKTPAGAACGPDDAWCVGPTRYHFTNGRTDREFINPQLTPHGQLGIRVNGAENAQPLISNVRQPRSSGLDLASNDLGVMFRTGSHTAGYALSSVDILFRPTGATPAGTVVKLATCAAPCVSPITLNDVATLVNPATLVSGPNRFTAPAAAIRLQPYSEYYVTVEGSAGTPWGTNSNAEDTGGLSGFAIGDRGVERAAAATGQWSHSGTAMASLKMLATVNGTAVVGVTG